MKKKEILNKYELSEATLRNWKKLGLLKNINNIDEEEIKNVLNNKAKIRRNKRNSQNHIIPESYVKNKETINTVEKLLLFKDKYHLSNEELLFLTIQKLCDNIPSEVYKILKVDNLDKYYQELNNIQITFSAEDDLLGLLYMSLLEMGKKDKKGIFFTPFKVVEEMVNNTSFTANTKVLDPGCGSGNFIMQIYKKMIKNGISKEKAIQNIYGYDNDKISVLLGKINLYLLAYPIKYNKINIYEKDFLLDEDIPSFDIVIGNPPWGIKYTAKEKKSLEKKYSLSFAKEDSFGQFIIKAFSVLKPDGTLFFVLPSSILNIAIHKNIRALLLKKNTILIKNIGRNFKEIVTDVVILKALNNEYNDNIIFNDEVIDKKVFLDNPNYSFLSSSNMANGIISKIKAFNSFHLDDTNSNFSLGIVTGNNQKYLLESPIKDAEPIISGKDLSKYNLNKEKINKYIVFKKENFQQVAPEENYRKEKIIYKFIGSKLCFSTDTNGYLTLNSANIINIYNHDIYYVSAILNSRVTQCFFDEIYKTHKVLKNHIKSFYIFNFNKKDTETIIKLSKDNKQNKYNEYIEAIIYRNLNLSEEEINYLMSKY